MAAMKTSFAQPGRAVQRLRGRGFPVACGVLALVSGSEAVRLILQGDSQSTRWSGWYLMVVSVLVASGALVGSADADPSPSAAESTSADEGEDAPSAATSYTREAVIFFIAAFVYAWALPWVGFAVANAAFVAAYLLFIDHRRWYVAVSIALVVDLCLVVGMDRLNVLLPTGVLGLGF